MSGENPRVVRLEPATSPGHVRLVDATDGTWGLGLDLVDHVAVNAKTNEAGQPFFEAKDVYRWDPRALRAHDLKKKTKGGVPDRRMTTAIVNDAKAPYEDARDGDAPYQQHEQFSSENRSTREVDEDGQTALPISHRKVIDSEDGRSALAFTLGKHDLAGAAAPPPIGATDDAGGGLPPGVSFSSDVTSGGQTQSRFGPSVSIGGTAGAVTFRGGAAVAAAQAAAARGGSASDVARAASNAARGLPPPPDRLWEGRTPGAPGDTSTRPKAPANPPTPAGSVVPENLPAGYVWDGDRVGLAKTFWTVRPGNVSPDRYFNGARGTPIGRLAARTDAAFCDGENTGAIRFVTDDASTVRRGATLFKGELRPDRSLANIDTANGLENCKFVAVVGVDAAIGPSSPPPVNAIPPSFTSTPVGGGGGPPGGGGGPPGGGGGGGGPPGGGGGGDPGAGDAPAADQVALCCGEATPGLGDTSGRGDRGITPTAERPRTPSTSDPSVVAPPVSSPSSQTRDFSGPGAPCLNATSGRIVKTSPTGDATAGGHTLSNPKLPPGAARTKGGRVRDHEGYPAFTRMGPGAAAVGGVESEDQRDLSSLGLGLPQGSGQPGAFQFTPAPNNDNGVFPLTPAQERQRQADAAQAAQERAAAEEKARVTRENGAIQAQRDRAQAQRDRARFLSDRGLPHVAASAERDAQRADAAADKLQARQASRIAQAEVRAQARQAAAADAQRRRDAAAAQKQQELADLQRRIDAAHVAADARRRAAAETFVPDGAYVIDVTGDSLSGPRAATPGTFGTPDERAAADAQGLREATGDPSSTASAFGDWNLANMPVPLLGQDGGAQTVEAHLHVLTGAHNAISKAVNGLMGGPSYFSGALGQRERPRPGKGPVGSDLGQHVTAGAGESVRVTRENSGLRVTSILEADAGGSIEGVSGGAALTLAREHRGAGSVSDNRPLLFLENGCRHLADLISEYERRFVVDHAGNTTVGDLAATGSITQAGAAVATSAAVAAGDAATLADAEAYTDAAVGAATSAPQPQRLVAGPVQNSYGGQAIDHTAAGVTAAAYTFYGYAIVQALNSYEINPAATTNFVQQQTQAFRVPTGFTGWDATAVEIQHYILGWTDSGAGSGDTVARVTCSVITANDNTSATTTSAHRDVTHPSADFVDFASAPATIGVASGAMPALAAGDWLAVQLKFEIHTTGRYRPSIGVLAIKLNWH